MAAPRTNDAVDVRSQVLAAAARLFAARGFEGTSLQEIADAVGVSKPAVLHHFPSKEHLRTAVLEDILAHWQKTLPRLMFVASADGSERFDAIFGEVMRFFTENPDRARVLQRETFDRPEDVRRLMKGPVRPWLAAIAELIRAARDDKGIHYENVDPEAYVVLALQMVLLGAATVTVASAAIDDDDDVARARYFNENKRFAKSALFVPSALKKG
jgi:AcrR family transcriptional regulator